MGSRNEKIEVIDFCEAYEKRLKLIIDTIDAKTGKSSPTIVDLQQAGSDIGALLSNFSRERKSLMDGNDEKKLTDRLNLTGKEIKDAMTIVTSKYEE